MKAVPLKRENGQYIQCEPHEATHCQIKFPTTFKPLQLRSIPVQIEGTRNGTANWSWNGDTEKPTFHPSILTEFCWGEEKKLWRCHTWVNDGKAQFLNDSNHEESGKTIDLLDIDDYSFKACSE